MDQTDANPSTCPACGGNDLFPVELAVSSRPVMIRLSFMESLTVQSWACMGCGFVATWAVGPTLAALRLAKAKRDAKAYE